MSSFFHYKERLQCLRRDSDNTRESTRERCRIHDFGRIHIEIIHHKKQCWIGELIDLFDSWFIESLIQEYALDRGRDTGLDICLDPLPERLFGESLFTREILSYIVPDTDDTVGHEV